MKFNKLHFGPAGFSGSDLNIPTSSKNPTADAILEISNVSLSALEIEFVRQVYLKRSSIDKLTEIKKNSENKNVALSIHAPYFINLNSDEEHKIINSHRYIIDSLNVGQEIGANIVVVHLGFFLKTEPKLAIENVTKEIEKIFEKTKSHTILGAETVGKKSQIGSLDEVLYFYDHLDKKRFLPVIDFAHLHARENGLFKDPKEIKKVFDQLKSYPDILNRMHIHMSGIEYTEKGERKHLIFQDADLPYKQILEQLKENNVKGTIICESPETIKDCLFLKKEWEKI